MTIHEADQLEEAENSEKHWKSVYFALRLFRRAKEKNSE